MMVAQTLQPENEVWLAFGTVMNYFQYLAAHQIAACLGSERSLALHALTGCDTVSAFVGHGKKTAWTIWNSDTLLRLAHAPNEVSEQSMHTIGRFVILLYDRTIICTDVNKARCQEGCLLGWPRLGSSTCPTAFSK